MTKTIHDIPFPGCTPEPLMSYLKALGILRLVSEQKDAEARGWWLNDVFYLRSPILFKDVTNDKGRKEAYDALLTFFLQEYKPTPILVPWSGGDFFGVNWQPQHAAYTKTPTASRAIEAILATLTPRFEPYRRALQACKRAFEVCGIDTKEKMGKQKWAFIQALRSNCGEPGLIEWMDAAAVGTVERFAALLGSGGGSDGNTHFSDNFMQNLWDMLPDFDSQRKLRGIATDKAPGELLHNALFKSTTNQLIEKRTSSLYDSGAVGGPNATQGMERDALSNPWNVILGLEGTICFAGAVTRRLGVDALRDGAFPFQVSASGSLTDRLADKEQGGKEIWVPLWPRPVQWAEVLTFLREGRAQCGSRIAGSGVDMARAISTLGIDRGISAFHRYAILKGRVGGENYNTAVALGRFDVCERAEVDLLREVDTWLDSFRRATGDKNAPSRFIAARRGIDSAIFDFCRYGGKPRFQRVLVALGRAERELALTEGNSKVKPLAGLSKDWIDAANDNSPEFDIALALSQLHDPKIGPLRANIEPVAIGRSQAGIMYSSWAEKDRAVVWNAADLATNLANVLQRRVMDGQRQGCEDLPLASRFTAFRDSIASFIQVGLDDRHIEDLIWGLMLIDGFGASPPRQSAVGTSDTPLPCEYALLKLMFLPRPLAADRKAGRVVWRLARVGESGIVIRPEPRILPLLRAGRMGEACQIAAQRLRNSGLQPMPGPLPSGVIRDADWSEPSGDPRRVQRLAAALLIPVASKAVNELVQLVCCDTSVAAESFLTTIEGDA